MDELKALVAELREELRWQRVVIEDLEERIEILEKGEES
jgi:hypothetical protein